MISIMAVNITKAADLIRNMGWRYVSFRVRYELLRRSGLYKGKFSSAPAFRQYITLEDWKKSSTKFFFESREQLSIPRVPTPELRDKYNDIREGKILMFNSLLTNLGSGYDWVTNPDSGYKYDITKHWTEIADYSPEAGDIKFVWEKSRFSYLYDVIRYDYHYGVDCAEFVFSEILSWIKSNPVNCGPNYRCSQEISLRVLNWTFALNYYKNSPFLTDEVFNQMQYAIFWQMDHVYKNIDFSRIAVRNNHAITESLALYLAGMFYPEMPGASEWKKDGRKWFEEEIAYQIYDDGTYLQFSMNYHRVVVQLLTWGIVLAGRNGEKMSNIVYDRAKRSVRFLTTCMVEENGWLPNYGANDGALFFKLSDGHFRDYRPQVQALAMAAGIDSGIGKGEDAGWYGITDEPTEQMRIGYGNFSFPKGGYYVIRESETLTFIKCGSYKDRPSQADNLHLDVWYKGENILIDAGSYKYNTDKGTMRYFSGTRSHNTVMLDDYDQMQKGGRFIWYHWPKEVHSGFSESAGSYVFEGAINVFRQLKKGIIHKRTVTKQKGKPQWEVHDEVIGAPAGVKVKQLWHLFSVMSTSVSILAKDVKGIELQPEVSEGWYSSLYGQKEKSEEVSFETEGACIETIIAIESE